MPSSSPEPKGELNLIDDALPRNEGGNTAWCLLATLRHMLSTEFPEGFLHTQHDSEHL